MTQRAVAVGLNKCSQSLLDHTKKVFTRQTSNYNFIFGRRGKGKTAFSLLIAQILKLFIPKLLIASNIKIFNAPFHIEFISDLETLQAWCEAYKSTPKLMILDEVGKIAKRRRFMAAINVKMIEDLQVLRKYDLNLIYIAPSESVIDSGLVDSDYLDGFYDKYSIDHLEYTDIYGRHRLDHVFTGIPFTDIKYDSHDTARFTEFPIVDKGQLFFEEEKLNKLYQWSQGARASEVGLTRKAIQEWIRKLTRRELQRISKEKTRSKFRLTSLEVRP